MNDSTGKLVVIDVRSDSEYEAGHVEGARHLTVTDLINVATGETSPLADVAPTDKIILYCTDGNQAQVAMDMLAKAGYTNLYNGISQRMVEAMLSTSGIQPRR